MLKSAYRRENFLQSLLCEDEAEVPLMAKPLELSVITTAKTLAIVEERKT